MTKRRHIKLSFYIVIMSVSFVCCGVETYHIELTSVRPIYKTEHSVWTLVMLCYKGGTDYSLVITPINDIL